ALANSSASAPSPRSIILMSSSTWVTTTRSSAPIARRSTASTRSWVPARPTRPIACGRPRPEARADPPGRESTGPGREAYHETVGTAGARPMTSEPILIAGGGIGGLAAALALAGNDRRVIVLEREARLEAVGAGLQLSPNAVHALRSFGIGSTSLTRAVRPDAI